MKKALIILVFSLFVFGCTTTELTRNGLAIGKVLLKDVGFDYTSGTEKVNYNVFFPRRRFVFEKKKSIFDWLITKRLRTIESMPYIVTEIKNGKRVYYEIATANIIKDNYHKVFSNIEFKPKDNINKYTIYDLDKHRIYVEFYQTENETIIMVQRAEIEIQILENKE